MMAYVPPAKRKVIFWLLFGLGFIALLLGTLSHQSFLSGMGIGMTLVAIVSVPLIGFKNRLRG